METPRGLPSGTPARATGYVRPSGGRRSLWWGLGIAAAIVLVFGFIYAAGGRGVASPGPVSAGHAALDSRCAECHEVGRAIGLRSGSATADLRCERCHDPGGSDRMTQASHVRRGTGNTAIAHRGESVACASCHVEHRGRAALARAVDDRACVRCHQIASLASHPEFAVVSAEVVTGVGLKFTHDRHLAEVGKQGGQRCEACHQPTADLSGFEPIDFDTHCASCHMTDGRLAGESDPIDGRLLSPPSTAGAPLITSGARSLVVVSRMAHRDEWALDNFIRLRRIVDPEGERAERLALRMQIAALTSAAPTQPLSYMTRADLERFREALERDKAAPAASGAGQDARTLTEMTAAVLRVADALNGQGEASPRPAADATPKDEDADAVRARFDARKAELLALLDAVAARGSPVLTARAATLRGRVTALTPSAGTAPAADADALRARLGALDDIFRAVRGLPDQQAASDAAAVAALRDAASRQIGGGLSIEQFEARRRELLRVLDAIGRQGDPAIASRVALLRQRVLLLQSGDVSSEERRARTQRLLDRVSLEIELAKGGETAAPAAVAPQRDRRSAQPFVGRLTRELARLDAPTGVSPVQPSPDAAAAALTTLAGPCLKCHLMDGARLAPVAAAARVLRRATFTHAPHAPQADCLSCHRGVTTSKLATDLVLPGVASCRSCHAPSKARSDCAACHSYHPAAAADVADLR